MAVTYQDYLSRKDEGDPVADEVVVQLLDNGQVNSVNKLFRQIETADQSPPADCPPVLRDYFESTKKMPDFFEPSMLNDIAEFFKHHKLPAAAVQATAGLVGTYLSPIGAKTLHSTHELDQPHRRLSQSTRLFTGMGDDDAFTPRSRLIPTCQKVRLVHAAIRQLHLRSGKWDRDKYGMPVSQYYTGGAAIVFSAGTLDALKRLGVNVTAREEYGYCTAWAIIAHYLGVPDEIIPREVDQVYGLWYSARDEEWAPSDEGILLTEECIKLYDRYVPPGITAAFVRRALSDKYADMVKVPESALFDTGADFASTADSLFGRTPVGNNDIVKTAMGKLGEAVEKVSREAFTHGQETEPQMTDRISKD